MVLCVRASYGGGRSGRVLLPTQGLGRFVGCGNLHLNFDFGTEFFVVHVLIVLQTLCLATLILALPA